MFQFEHPEHLHALWIVVLLFLIFLRAEGRRQQKLKALGNPQTVKKLMPGYAPARRKLKAALLLLALGSLAIAWANPQWGMRKVQRQGKSADVFIALDISRSMMANDVPPNRIERGRKFAERLIDELTGDRIGLIVFAGGAFVQMPLSNDYQMAQLLLKTANTDMTDQQGTAIADAIELAMQSYDPEDERARALVIISDGETHDEETLQLAKKAGKDGIVIITVGVGTPKGGSIYVTDSRGNSGILLDRTGQPVITRLEEENLRKIARTAKGSYFLLSGDTDAVAKKVAEQLRKLERKITEERSYTERKSYYLFFVLLALGSLLLHSLLPWRKK